MKYESIDLSSDGPTITQSDCDIIQSEGAMNEHWTYQAGWHRGFAAGFACAAVVALGCIFVLLAFGTFDKPVQTQIKGKK